MTNLTPMDYIRAALANAVEEQMTATDLLEVAIHSETPEAFDEAVNMLVLATERKGWAWTGDGYFPIP